MSSSVEVYVLWGQSNAEGQGDATTLAASLQAVLVGTPLKYYCQFVGGAFDNYGWVGLQPRPAAKFGMEIQFAHSVADTGRRIVIIKYTVSGSGLEADWLPTIYALAQAFTDAALAQIAAVFGPVVLRALIWVQGETDATAAGPASRYQANLTTLWNQFLAHYSPTYGANIQIMVYLLYYAVVEPFLDEVRQAETDFVAATAHAFLLDIDSTPNALYGDNLHLNNDGLLALGAAAVPIAIAFPQAA